MGLLSDFTAYVDSLKRRGANTARELVADPMGLLGRNVSAFSESLPAAPGEPQNEMLARPGMQDWATGVAMNAPTMGLLGHTVYHGSPHKFDKFDASKIGTGEGAQAYGHGLYFADNPATARSYQEALSSQNIRIGDKLFTPADLAKMPDAKRAAISAGSHQGVAGNLKRAKEMLDEGADPNWVADFVRYTNEMAGKKLGRETAGTIYKTDLPDEWLPKMLDWDKPLSQQHRSVKDALKKSGLLDDASNPLPAAALGGELKTAGDAMHALKRQWENDYGADALTGIDAESGAAATSEFLRSLGIPGVRYLDQGSRKTGEGSYNYVVFPGMEHLLKILERE